MQLKRSDEAKTTFDGMVTLSIVLTYLASEIYLPAMPVLQAYLGASTSALQSTISIFVFGSAVAQFIGGPLIDRFSYRHMALLMCCIFIVASVGCAFAHSLNELRLARLLQAFSAATLAIIGRASLTRKFNAEVTVRIYLFISPLLSSSLSFSPLLGGYITTWLGWRAVFYTTAFLGGILLLLVYLFLFLQEGRTRVISLHPLSIMRTYVSLFKTRMYMGVVIAVGALFAEVFAYLTESPFIFNDLGYKSSEIGSFYIILSLAYILGSLYVRLRMNKVAYSRMIKFGFSMSALALVLLFFTSWHHVLSQAYQIFLPLGLMGFANGILVPLMMGKLLGLFPEKAGYAAGLMSAMTLFLSALSATFVHQVTQGEVVLLSLYMGAILGFGLFAFVVGRAQFL